MKLYRLATGLRISPFNDPVGDTLIANESLRARITRLALLHGLGVEDIDSPKQAIERPALLIADNVYVSDLLFAKFVEAARQSSGPGALALPQSVTTRYARPLQSCRETVDDAGRPVIQYDFFLLGQAPPQAKDSVREWLAELGKQSKNITIPIKNEIVLKVRLPRVQGAPDYMEAPLAARFAAHVDHWVHILWVNQAAIGVAFVDQLMKRSRWQRLWGLLRFLLLGGLFRGRRGKVALVQNRLRQIVVEGRDCVVDPTARLESTILGDNVVVGPGAQVRNCIIGDGAEIAENATLSNCVIGDGVLVLRDTFMSGCVSWPNCTLGNYKVQTCLFGRNTFLTSSVALIDAKFNGPIQVMHEGRLQSTGTPFLGSVLGHNVTIGAHVTVQSGREIPNGVTIINPPEDVLQRIPAGLPTNEPLVVHEGTLVPLSRYKSGGAA
ncbi:MAG: hypothetical protein GMKNLPBB_01236 [Myxococcota bacterium]|nr:hypothetical protein [Myxococcota bacterium]